MYSQKTDQALKEFQRMYNGRSESDCKAFREWLETINRLADALNDGLIGAPALALQVVIADQTFDGDEFYIGSGALPPDLLLDAVNSWESGKEFTPTGWNLE